MVYETKNIISWRAKNVGTKKVLQNKIKLFFFLSLEKKVVAKIFFFWREMKKYETNWLPAWDFLPIWRNRNRLEKINTSLTFDILRHLMIIRIKMIKSWALASTFNSISDLTYQIKLSIFMHNNDDIHFYLTCPKFGSFRN